MSRARDLSRLSNQTNFTPDVATGRVGLGSENPTAKLNVAGIVSATAFYGDGSNLEGVSGSGIGTALADEGVNSLVYYADKILGIVENTTIDVPDTSDSNVAYTKYAEVSVSDGIDLIIADGDDFIPDILGISSDVQVPGVLAGNGGRVRADNFSNKAGTGAPNFPSGLTGTTGSFTGNVSVGGVLTYEDVTNIDSVGLVTARTGLRVTDGGLIVTAGVSTLAADLSIADKIVHTGDTNTAIRFPAADTFTVETAGSERLRITSNGNIGINSIPSTKLDIYRSGSGVVGRFGKESIFGELFVAGEKIGLQGTRSSDSAVSGFFVENPSSTGTSNFELITIKTAGTERLRIASSGQIGLGGANYGTAGQAIVSNGSGSAPTWQDVASGISTQAGTASGIVTSMFLNDATDHKVTATGICTITTTQSGTEGQSHTIRIVNSGIATVGFSTYFLFPSGSAPVLPTTDGTVSIISFTVHDSVGAGCTQLLAGAALNFS